MAASNNSPILQAGIFLFYFIVSISCHSHLHLQGILQERLQIIFESTDQTSANLNQILEATAKVNKTTAAFMAVGDRNAVPNLVKAVQSQQPLVQVTPVPSATPTHLAKKRIFDSAFHESDSEAEEKDGADDSILNEHAEDDPEVELEDDPEVEIQTQEIDSPSPNTITNATAPALTAPRKAH